MSFDQDLLRLWQESESSYICEASQPAVIIQIAVHVHSQTRIWCVNCGRAVSR